MITEEEITEKEKEADLCARLSLICLAGAALFGAAALVNAYHHALWPAMGCAVVALWLWVCAANMWEAAKTYEYAAQKLMVWRAESKPRI